MPSQTHLLNRAYSLMENSQLNDAELVIEALIANDPQNLDAWKAYIHLCNSAEDLEWLKERIILTREIRAADKCELLIYHEDALRQLLEVEKPYARMWVDADDYDDPKDVEEARIIFELLEEFQFAESKPQNIQQPPKPSVIGSSYSFPVSGFGLLAIFFIAIRFLVLGYFSGYPLLILLLFGFARWLDESSKGG